MTDPVERRIIVRKSGKKTRQLGNIAIEFALVSPLFLLLLAAIVEIGFAFYQSMLVESSVEAGGLYAAHNGWNSTGIAAAVVNATGASGITASPAPQLFCGCPASTGITTISCTSTCTGGISPSEYVQVNASIAHQPILSASWLTIPTTLTSQSIIRIK